MPELCLSYAPRCRGPRPPLAASGQRSAHPLPSRSRLRPRSSSSSSSYSWPTDLLSRGVVSPHGYPCPTRPRRRRRVFVVRRRRDASLTLRRDSRPTGSNDARARERAIVSARSLASGSLRSSVKTSAGSSPDRILRSGSQALIDVPFVSQVNCDLVVSYTLDKRCDRRSLSITRIIW